MSKNVESRSVWARPFEGEIAYEMSKTLAKEILATRKGADQNKDPQEFLCRVVDETFGLKGHCTQVFIV